MRTVTTLDDLRAARTLLPEPAGLVPTMGYLHDGHLSLVRRAAQECASTIVSIFVNPTQFGPHEDLDDYPRDLEADLEMLATLDVDLVWVPTVEIMYPPNFQTWVTVDELTQVLEGRARPNHFRGVTTIVTKLFAGVQPQKAYFGQKDAQQAMVIQRMTQDLGFPIDIVVCPTVRENDGLAKSSRNRYLGPQERRAATVIYRALQAAQTIADSGETRASVLRDTVSQAIAGEPLARLQYVSCANPETLQEVEEIGDRALISLAVFVGNTRLIDNVFVGQVA